MAKKDVLRIVIEDGKFKSGTEVLTDKPFKVSPTKFSKTGWKCEILADKSLKCVCEEKRVDGKHSIKYVIDSNGDSKLTLKIPGKGTKVLAEGNVFIKANSLTNGTLRLSKNNELHNRIAFFIEA
ncbi:MAG: hypothetical protein IJN50_01825 [Clostridia bacterium]|nr:hypothetical protein [Clostridia bacterium]